jgi:hypothetical protein
MARKHRRVSSAASPAPEADSVIRPARTDADGSSADLLPTMLEARRPFELSDDPDVRAEQCWRVHQLCEVFLDQPAANGHHNVGANDFSDAPGLHPSFIAHLLYEYSRLAPLVGRAVARDRICRGVAKLLTNSRGRPRKLSLKESASAEATHGPGRSWSQITAAIKEDPAGGKGRELSRSAVRMAVKRLRLNEK